MSKYGFPGAATIFPTESIVLGLVSLYEFDETGGALFVDDGLAGVDMDIQGSWADLTTGSLVVGVGGTSAYTDGSAYATIPASQAAHDLSELTLSFYYQPITAVARHSLFVCGDGSQPGDFSIEVLPDGRLRAWHTDAAGLLRFFESTNGIAGTNLAIETAHRIDLRLGGPQSARISLNGVQVAEIPGSTNSWNNSRVKYLGRWVDGTKTPAVGIFDRLRIWDRAKTNAELGLLEPAQAYTINPPLSIWSLDEESAGGGVFADTGSASVDMTIVGTWQDLTSDPLVVGDSGTSAFTEGAGYATLPADDPDHNLAALTLSLYYQRASSAAKQILFACGDGSAVGDFSLEVLANGQLRGWHVGADGLLDFFQATTGIVGTNLATGVAHRIDLSMGPAGVHVYLDGAELPAAANPNNTNAWNNGRVKYLGRWTNGVQSPAIGIFDHVRLWGRQRSATEIAGLAAAQSITGGGVPPDEEFTCPARPDATVVNTHKDLGTVAGPRSLNNTSGAPSYVCTGTVATVTWASALAQNPTLAGFRYTGDHNGACDAGIAVQGNVDESVTWNELYPDNGGGVGVLFGQAGGAAQEMLNILCEGARIDLVWDAFRMPWINPRGNFHTIRGAWCSRIRDDTVENDQIRTVHIIDCLFDGVFSGISTDNTASSVPGGTEVVLNGVLIRMRPYPVTSGGGAPNLNPGYAHVIKNGRAGNNVPHDAINCVFAFQQAGNTGGISGEPNGNPFRRLLGDGTIRTWTGNTICWLGAGAYPWASNNPNYRGSNGTTFFAGTTILTGSTARDFWTDARAAWIAAHPLVKRFGSPADDGFAFP